MIMVAPLRDWQLRFEARCLGPDDTCIVQALFSTSRHAGKGATAFNREAAICATGVAPSCNDGPNADCVVRHDEPETVGCFSCAHCHELGSFGVHGKKGPSLQTRVGTSIRAAYGHASMVPGGALSSNAQAPK